MELEYEIKDKRLKDLVEKKAEELHMSVGEVIWGYINRGLLSDDLGDEVFYHTHSEEFLNEVNEALGLEPWRGA